MTTSDSDDFAARWAPTLHIPQPRVEEPDRQETADADTDQKNDDLKFQSGNDTWEEADNAANGDGPHTGVMVAFFPSAQQAAELAIEGGEAVDELHLTLAFLGNVGAEITADQEQAVINAVTGWAATQQPVEAITNGLGIFLVDSAVTYANVDAPALPAARQSLVEALDHAGLAPLQNHGYTPHITLVYADQRDIAVPVVDMLFDTVTVAFAGKRSVIPLKGVREKAAVGEAVLVESPLPYKFTGVGTYRVEDYYSDKAPFTFTKNTSAGTAQVFERLPEAEGTLKVSETIAPEPVKAFVTDINGHTLIAAPASITAAAMREPTLDDIITEHMLYIDGKFVGAEVPNRNGALWSAGDLELSRESVLYGPLNWLHEARHVIGSLTDATFVQPEPQGLQMAADLIQPHITAKSAVWRWIWPDEAYVIEQASDLGQLWYSMECISKEVGCAGPDGCGKTVSYAQYMAGGACEHITQRASVRHFKNPVFLGGAVIVPPTRPGWAEADASVMKAASKVAEAAFDQSGQPDITASAWEQMMAQLVRYADSPGSR